MGRARWFVGAVALIVTLWSADAGTQGRCAVVEVVYPDGRPVAGAQVTHYFVDPHTNRAPMDGESFVTGRDGRACEERLLDSGYLDVAAPTALGGWCAAYEEMPYVVPRRIAGREPVTRVTLHMRWLHRASWSGRVVAADGTPLEGALVYVDHVWPDGTQCSELGDGGWHATARDGTFRLPPLARGLIELIVKRDGYAEQNFKVTLPSRPRDLVIDRGAEWTGRVLDPDGSPIESCRIVLRRPDGVEVGGRCSPTGFALRQVPPGDVKLTLYVERHPLLGKRAVALKASLAPREVRHEDIRWPVGAAISGQVVDAEGRPVAAEHVAATSTDVDKSNAEGVIELSADEQGRFVIPDLAPGRWNVMAGWLYEAKTTVEAGAHDVRLVMPASRR